MAFLRFYKIFNFLGISVNPYLAICLLKKHKISRFLHHLKTSLIFFWKFVRICPQLRLIFARESHQINAPFSRGKKLSVFTKERQ